MYETLITVETDDLTLACNLRQIGIGLVFADLVDRLGEPLTLFREAISTESQRFELWATNLGLYHSGHSSLDYRFRDAPSLYEFAHKLLRDVERYLSLSRSASFNLRFLSNNHDPNAYYWMEAIEEEIVQNSVSSFVLYSYQTGFQHKCMLA